MGQKIKIALLSHSAEALDSLRTTFEAVECAVTIYTDSARLLEDLIDLMPDMVIYLDDSVGADIDIIGHLRRVASIPLAVVTAKKDEIDEILMLKLGADLVVQLPYSQRLLRERVHAVLRRVRYEHEKYGIVSVNTLLVRDELVLDSERYTCKWKGETISLTAMEFSLLSSLAKRPGIIKTRENLLDDAYMDEIYVEDRAIDSHIKRIRQKFKKVDRDFDKIETVYGLGYRYKTN